MTSVPVRELRNHTADVLRLVQAGDNVTITQNGVPVAALVPIRTRAKTPIGRADLTRLLQRHPPDDTLARDLIMIAGDSTDDLGPVR